MLQNEGLVSLTRGHGAEVAHTDLSRIRNACLVREVLDGLAARLAASAVTQELRAVLPSCLDQQRAVLQEWDKYAFTRADADLHVALMESTRNSYLIAHTPLIRMTCQVFHPAMHYSRSRAEAALEGHERIVAAVLDGDCAAAESEARAHLRMTIDTIEAITDAEGAHAGALLGIGFMPADRYGP